MWIADVDECADNNGGCNTNAACTNQPGSFACTCNDNYIGDGFTCECQWTTFSFCRSFHCTRPFSAPVMIDLKKCSVYSLYTGQTYCSAAPANLRGFKHWWLGLITRRWRSGGQLLPKPEPCPFPIFGCSSIKASKQLYMGAILEGWSCWFVVLGLCFEDDD